MALIQGSLKRSKMRIHCGICFLKDSVWVDKADCIVCKCGRDGKVFDVNIARICAYFKPVVQEESRTYGVPKGYNDWREKNVEA